MLLLCGQIKLNENDNICAGCSDHLEIKTILTTEKYVNVNGILRLPKSADQQ